jgi:hypothetical protein
MALAPWLQSWYRRPSVRRRLRPMPRTRLAVERLEARTVPTILGVGGDQGAGVGAPGDGAAAGDPGTDGGDAGSAGGNLGGIYTGPGPGTPGGPNSGSSATDKFDVFVTRLYLDLLQRPPQQADIAFWTNALRAGASRDQVASAFTSSTEYRLNLVTADFNAILGHDPSAGAAAAWAGAFSAGWQDDTVLAKLLASHEFYKNQGQVNRDWVIAPPADDLRRLPLRVQPDQTNLDWLAGVYGVVLGRAPDQDGLNYFDGLLKRGVSREVLATTLLQSDEARGFVISDAYQALLRRAPDADGHDAWLSGLHAGLTTAQFLGLIAGSGEYYTDAYVAHRSGPLAVVQARPESVPSGATAPGAGSTFFVSGTSAPDIPVVISVDGAAVLRTDTSSDGLWKGNLPATMNGGDHKIAVMPFGRGRPPARPTPGGKNGSWSPAFHFHLPNQEFQPGRFPVVDATGGSGNEWEVDIGINPINPANLFLAANEDTSNAGLFASFSGDGGLTWQTRIIADGTDGFTSACCDPSVSWDAFGNLFLAYLDANAANAVLLLSTDGGQSFTQLTSLTAQDQPKVTTGAGEVWMVWNNGNVTAAGAAVAGLGQVGTFSTPETVPNSNGGNFGTIAIGPAGQVVVSFQNAGSGVGPDTIQTAVDADGLGANGFANATTAASTNVGGFRPIAPQPQRTIDADGRVAFDRSPGAHNGRLYLDYVNAPSTTSDDTNIFVQFSDDNGATWSTPVQVNDDTTTNSQFWPRLAVDQTSGNVAVSWYDARNDPGSGPGDRDGVPNTDTEFFATLSFDGGATFLPNVQISTSPSSAIANPNNGNDYGDYTGLAFFNGIFYPAWADNSADLSNSSLPNFDIAVGIVPVTPRAGAGSGSIPDQPPDVFEFNDTSDRATNFGVLLAGTNTFAGLTVGRHLNSGLPDYDWYRFTIGQAGVFSTSINDTSLDLELHLFTIGANNTLIELGSVTQLGLSTRSLATLVHANQTIFVEVKGEPLAPGLFAQGVYDLTYTLQ